MSDEIADLVTASLATGPKKRQTWRQLAQCPGCGAEWHGLQNDRLCQGSHTYQGRK